MQARDLRLMITPDENGQLPLHRALRDNAAFGSIELLVKGNPSAITNFDNRGMTPLHMACQHHNSPKVVEYLVGLNPTTTLLAIDFDQNSALHHACRGAKYDTIALLLEKYGAASVSKRNVHNKLPIHLLLESGSVRDGGGVNYIESVYQLIRAHPETVIDGVQNMRREQQSDAKDLDFVSQNRNKRKLKKIAVSTKMKSRGKRMKFTDSEDAAIRNGVERFGVGRWAGIKSYYHIDLADRTPVQIKDRWRTLTKCACFYSSLGSAKNNK